MERAGVADKRAGGGIALVVVGISLGISAEDSQHQSLWSGGGMVAQDDDIPERAYDGFVVGVLVVGARSLAEYVSPLRRQSGVLERAFRWFERSGN
ncbi:hypothetical protein LY76DRAFT_590196 [Colletotrichum caudatum]|nr:hypothetical protein LY76DRAFT_590196 [Colletotrichum caudatum]